MEGFMRKIYNFINGLEVLHLIGGSDVLTSLCRKRFFISARHGYLRNDNIAMSVNYIRYSLIVNRYILVTSLEFVNCPMFRCTRFFKRNKPPSKWGFELR